MKGIVVALLAGLVLALSAGCQKEECTAKSQADCVCYEIYAPVCGCDGVTYGNDCHANCAGVDYEEGECK